MLILYIDAEDRLIELDVEPEVGKAYYASLDLEERNDRANTRRQESLSEWEYEDKRFFDTGVDLETLYIENEFFEKAFAGLSERQRYLVEICVLGNLPYAKLARVEGKDESAIRHAVERALKKIKKNLI